MGESPDVFERRMATPDGRLRGPRRKRRDAGNTEEERAVAASLLPEWHPERPVAHTVYELRHPIPGAWRPERRDELPAGTHPDTFYVGKLRTDVNRLANHVYQAVASEVSSHRLNVIRQLLRGGSVPTLVTIARFATEEEAFAFEGEQTRRYPQGYLTNARDGGLTGWTASPETRAKLSAALKGRPIPDHVRAAQRAAVTGRPKTPGEIERLRSAMADRVFTPEHRQHLADGHWTKDPHRARETAEKLRAALTGRNPKFDADAQADAFRRYREGEPYEVIAAALGLNLSHLAEHLSKAVAAGLLPPRDRRAGTDKDLQQARLLRAAAMHKAGASVSDIQADLGLSAASSVYSLLDRAARAGLIQPLAQTKRERQAADLAAGRASEEATERARAVARVLQMRDAGERISVITADVGKDRHWVTSTLRDHGRSSDDRLTDTDNATIAALNAAGVSQGELARRYGVSRPRIGQIIAAAKVSRGD